MEYLITDVSTSLCDNKVEIFFETDPFWSSMVSMPFSDAAREIPGLSVFEIELLIGSKFVPKSYYILGDKLPDGQIVKQFPKFPKTWKIKANAPLVELRENNTSRLRMFEQIEDIEIIEDLYRTRTVKVSTDEGGIYFTNVMFFESLMGVREKRFNDLIGAHISPVFYNKGDKTVDGIIVEKYNTLVSSYNIRIPGTLGIK